MGYRILFLYDSKEHVQALEDACKLGGHELVVMRTVGESLEWLNRKDHIDVIVSATHLETESVFDFLNAVKKDPRHSWVQFVMLSSNQSDLADYLHDTVKHTARILGADKYVVMNVFCPLRLLKEIEAAFPSSAPQKDLDPVGDAIGIPRRAEDVPSSVDDAQHSQPLHDHSDADAK